jgi:phosphate transport system protein
VTALERYFDGQLEDLKKLLLTMGGHVEEALEHAMSAIIAKDIKRFSLVHEIEKKINSDHIKVDVACMDLLAKQGPVAKDLRLIISIIKINTDLERMGDQSVNIAYTGRDYLERAAHLDLQKIQKMGQAARAMVKESLDCFVRADVELAKKILLMDDEVDSLKEQIFTDMTLQMKSNPAHVEAAMDLILVARNLERLGDHATNIAEDVIFAFTGRDIRHGNKSKVESVD